MKRELVPVHVNGIFVCDTEKFNQGCYWKYGGRWNYYFADEWILVSDAFAKYIADSLRKVLSKALRHYRRITPCTYPHYKNPIVYIGNPPEEKC